MKGDPISDTKGRLILGRQIAEPGVLRWIRRIPGTPLFRDDFNRAYRWIVDSRSKVNLDFALGRGLNMLE
jgi:hypothetical protein